MNDNDIFRFINWYTDPAVSAEDLAGFLEDLKAVEAESIGWTPLESGAYLHLGAPGGCIEDMVIEVVGSVTSDMVDMNILLLT